MPQPWEMNWGDPQQAPQQPAPAGPVLGPPPKPKEPPQPKTTYRTLSPDEVNQHGLNPDTVYQISSEGNITAVTGQKNTDKPTEAQQKISTLTTRIAGGFRDIQNVVAKDPSAQEPGIIETMRGGLEPGGLMGIPARAIAGGNRRTVHDAQRDALDALLTLGTGAAYNQEQLTGMLASYFPQYGDTPQEIAAKNNRMMRLIASAKANAGSAWDQVAPQIEQYMTSQPSDGQGGDQQVKDTWDGLYFDQYGNPLAPDGGLAYDKNGNMIGMVVRVTDDSPNNPPPDGGGATSPFMAGVGDIVQGTGDLLGVVGNPLNATINAVAGTNLSTNLGETLRGMTGIGHGDPTIEAINRGATGALAGSIAAKGAATIANPGAWQNALMQFGSTPIRDTVAGGTAGLSADVARQNGAGPLGQTAAAVAGGMGGYGIAGGLAKAGAPRVPSEVMQAADRQGVGVLPADVGGPTARRMTTATSASPLSASPVVKASQRNIGQLSEAAARIADNQGTRVTSDVAGENVRAAGMRYTKETRARGERLYNRAAEGAKGVKIKPVQTIQAVDEQLARLRENPAPDTGAIKELETFKANVESGVTVQGLRDARTELATGVYSGKMRSTAEQGRWKAILGNVADDINGGLRQAGRTEAANMFKVADKFWAGRVEHIDQVLEPIIGKGKSGEQIVGAIEGMARGNGGGNARLSRLLSGMSPQEAGSVRATIIDRMGRANHGAQTAEGDAFSPSTFLTNWNKMTPQGKASLFGDSKMRKDLNDIALVAEHMKATQAMANHSNTGLVLTGNIGAGAYLAVNHPVAAVLGATGQYLSGRLMASTGFARILAKTAKMPPEAAQRSMIDSLGVLMTREPLIRQDAAGLQRYLQQTLGQSPTRAAASPGQEENNRWQKPPQ